MLVKQQLATQEAEFATLIATHCQTLYVFYMSDIPYIPSNVFTKFVLFNVFTKKYIFQYLSLKYVWICQTKAYHIVVPFIRK